MSNLTVQVTDRGTEPRSTSSDDVFSGTVVSVQQLDFTLFEVFNGLHMHSLHRQLLFGRSRPELVTDLEK